jgi:general secretion pathway protein F
MTRPPFTITAPTAGLGLVMPSPFRASANARRMNLLSVCAAVTMSQLSSTMRLSLQQKELFFHDLGQLLRSGQTLPQALELKTKARLGAARHVASAMLDKARESNAEGYFAAVPEVFTGLDREIVRGGELAGRLDDTMLYLSGYYGTLAKTQRRLLAQSAYPIFLLHFGALMLGIPDLMTGGMEAFVWSIAKLIGTFYIAFAVGWLLFLAILRAAREAPLADQILQSIPAIGGARVALVGSRFCMLMGILVKSSGSILSAMNRAASASGSALFQRGADEAVRAIQAGGTLGAAMRDTRAFPEGIERAFQTGESAGRLDEEMQLQAARYTEQFQGRIDLLSGTLSKLIYLCIAGALAYRIIQFWLGYYSMSAGLFE